MKDIKRLAENTLLNKGMNFLLTEFKKPLKIVGSS